MNAFQKAWRGEERLWKVWWLGGCGLAILEYCWGRTIVRGLYCAAPGGPHGDAQFAYLLATTPILFLWTAQWRCAFNVTWRPWGYLARIVLPISVVISSLSLLHGFALLNDDPAAWAIERSTPRPSASAGQSSPPVAVQTPQYLPYHAPEVTAAEPPAPAAPAQPYVAETPRYPTANDWQAAPTAAVPEQRAMPPLLGRTSASTQIAEESGVGEVAFQRLPNSAILKLTDQINGCRGGRYFYEEAGDGLTSRDGCWAARAPSIIIEYRGGDTFQYPLDSFVAVSYVFSALTQ
ncbi:hypothetical protein [Paraburkholderia flagellata]|uniref:hypothetical protein n=1 Tax=Paraburkholderia flagellata TaxID=2883241 RepID=UPI001F1DBCDE|nr:hypothetical protein [Paraburkholderia flagellata]